MYLGDNIPLLVVFKVELVSVDARRGAETVVVGVHIHLALSESEFRLSRRQKRRLVADEVVRYATVVRRAHGVERHQEVVDHDGDAIGRQKHHDHNLKEIPLSPYSIENGP